MSDRLTERIEYEPKRMQYRHWWWAVRVAHLWVYFGWGGKWWCVHVWKYQR